MDTQTRNQSAQQASNLGASNRVFLADYKPSAFLIEKTVLDFQLFDEFTAVTSRLSIQRNPDTAAEEQSDDLVLQGNELTFKSAVLNGNALTPEHYSVDPNSLTIYRVPDRFELEISVEIDPDRNLSLEGLYRSEGMYCTQCEAEGFKRITYFLDRPDVMSVFSTRIEADRARYPVLLSNGNKIDAGDLEGGRHWALWEDPFKKPCYLFALVAGDLDCLRDSFVTCSGREVSLEIYAEQKDLDKCEHAMLSLKRAMHWDEEVYGREYDLDLYMIVAVSFFNMGAMENKGLNIFNTSAVLAHADTQTDAAFQRVEAIVAHEYFHNWSGNRVTCRDWFQLSLKEGFTVFRDACFSADLNSATVKRIEDVDLLRSAQFVEDAGPMAHPVRPESYEEISNFYTLTIYEKGAEVIRMQRELLGEEAFRRGTDLYFERHDGQAVTCEDFIVALEDASGVDLKQFRRWYSQAGTPTVEAVGDWDQAAGRYTLTLSQRSQPSPGQENKLDYHIPVSVSFVDAAGNADVQASVLDLTEAEQSWSFSGFDARPVPAILRGFSAPVKLHCDYSFKELLQLIEWETDGYSRWDAAQRYFFKLLSRELQSPSQFSAQQDDVVALVELFDRLLESGIDASSNWNNDLVDAAMLAQIISLPAFSTIIDQNTPADVSAISRAMQGLQSEVAQRLRGRVNDLYIGLDQQLKALGAYQPESSHIALRSLKNTLLALLVYHGDSLQLADRQYHHADNMSDRSAALAALCASPSSDSLAMLQTLLDDFYERFKHEDLVVNEWLRFNASIDHGSTLMRVRELMAHPAYDDKNPNKIRSLIASFANRNLTQFHGSGSAGYELLAKEVLRVDQFNPQIAARLVTPLTHFARFTDEFRQPMIAQVEWLASQELSDDSREVIGKALEVARSS